ncbi:TetR/AcrR family transcriptional regulator [Pseudonocardia endophytica]|uniref:TetR family transcriptional regulator n=1 Tax=Pseudonocardia endophytica TaxID=401976 RepID=A0A4R1I2V4_PSEEN|nr:TetR/AcrR family transcriptional regulator [Pseudonocardia endophytica]TCK27640.1 TetR family transcriptional regulator [Pseudonocardia endophytica]
MKASRWASREVDVTGSGRRKRADGQESQRRILDAAAEIAGERGYDGTSISAVSKRCGLPASSIYWHFTDKDELIAAVIERSFETWLAAVQLPDEQAGDPAERAAAMSVGVAKALLETPDFLRLGLLLTLERRPTEPTARTRFLQVREVARDRVQAALDALAPGLPEASARRLTTYALAGADGLFIAHQIHGDDVDLLEMFALHARLLTDAIARESADGAGSVP